MTRLVVQVQAVQVEVYRPAFVHLERLAIYVQLRLGNLHIPRDLLLITPLQLRKRLVPIIPQKDFQGIVQEFLQALLGRHQT